MKEKLIYIGVIFSISLFVLLLQFYKVEPFETFSLRFNDTNFALQEKEPSKDVIFVAVDEPSVNRFGRWPWDRAILAKGIENLSFSDVVMLDMIFSEETTQEKDYALSDSLSNLNASVCGFFLRHNATQEISEDALEVLSDSALDLLHAQISEFHNPTFIAAKHAEMNILPILESCSLSGSFTTVAGSDTLLRSYPVAVYYHDMLFPSLSIQALRLRYDKDISRVSENEVSINEKLIKLNKQGFVRLNYYKKEQYETVSFLDVYEQKIKPEYFKNKIVILGITEVGAGDVASTPIGSIPGPLVHYTFLSNILQGHLIRDVAYVSSALVVAFSILALLLVLFIKQVTFRAISYVSAYLIVYGIVRYLFVLDMLYIDLFFPLMSLILSATIVEGVAFNIQEKGGRFIRDAFSSYLSADLLDELIKNPQALTLGGENKELSILFSDIRGFTTISESMDPVSLINLLNRYFTPMTNTVMEHKGMLDKYIGDAVMAFFNAPIDVVEHPDAACKTALEMIERLKLLNVELIEEGINPIKIGIGINTAEVVVGNMGSDTRFNYTVIGDGVNLASRVEGLTKNYGVEILITEFTVAKLHHDFIYRMIEPVKVKGKDEAVLLYELMPQDELSNNLKEKYDKALELYKEQNLKEAQQIFIQLVEDYDDGPSKYFLKNIEVDLQWGVHKMTTK